MEFHQKRNIYNFQEFCEKEDLGCKKCEGKHQLKNLLQSNLGILFYTIMINEKLQFLFIHFLIIYKIFFFSRE